MRCGCEDLCKDHCFDGFFYFPVGRARTPISAHSVSIMKKQTQPFRFFIFVLFVPTSFFEGCSSTLLTPTRTIALTHSVPVVSF